MELLRGHFLHDREKAMTTPSKRGATLILVVLLGCLSACKAPVQHDPLDEVQPTALPIWRASPQP
jgi:hypothetical protein